VADQATVTGEGTGAVAPAGAASTVAHGTSAAHSEHNPGRPISWIGTSITIIGFCIGGVAFPISNPAPNWLVFWLGSAVALVGLFTLLFSKAMTTDWY